MAQDPIQSNQPEEQGPPTKPKPRTSFVLIFAITFLLFMPITLAVAGTGAYWTSLRGMFPAYGGTSVDCTSAKVFQKYPQYRPLVADAASRYLNGDQAILIALIQWESSWDKDSRNPDSTATGLGQFLDKTNPTENGKPFFQNISFDGVDPNDDRRNPTIAVPATAFYYKAGIDKAKDKGHNSSTLDLYRWGYLLGYHGGGNKPVGSSQYNEGIRGAAGILNLYVGMTKDGSCVQSANYPLGSGGWDWPLRPMSNPSNLNSGHNSFNLISDPGTPTATWWASADYGGGNVNACTPVYALGNGTIEFHSSGSGYWTPSDPYMYKGNRGYNAIFRSADGKVKAIYAHIYRDNVASQPSFNVKGGEQFGRIFPYGDTNPRNCGKSSGPHLHFQLLVNNQWIRGNEQINVIRNLISTNSQTGGATEAEGGFTGDFRPAPTEKPLRITDNPTIYYDRPTYVVLHYTASDGDADNLFTFFDGLNNDGIEDNNKYVQYFIQKDGQMFKFLPETRQVAGACGFNRVPAQFGGGVSISIENQGDFSRSDSQPTQKQINANITLIKYLMAKWQIPKSNIISHAKAFALGQEANSKNGCPGKIDPGDNFMNKVLSGLP